MARNKIIYGNETLIDLSGDTARESDVALGKIFHKADGSQATGTATGGVVSGSFSSYTAAETKTIDTGLSTIKKFSIHMKWLRGTAQLYSSSFYNRSNSTTTYGASAGVNASTGYGGGGVDIGTVAQRNYCLSIMQVSGGTVKVQFPAVSNSGSVYIIWYAE